MRAAYFTPIDSIKPVQSCEGCSCGKKKDCCKKYKKKGVHCKKCPKI